MSAPGDSRICRLAVARIILAETAVILRTTAALAAFTHLSHFRLRTSRYSSVAALVGLLQRELLWRYLTQICLTDPGVT
jgi:hypothetical protein